LRGLSYTCSRYGNGRWQQEREKVVEHQHIKTNVMHFLFNLLRIKGLYMFRALLDHLQEALAQTVLGILLACYVIWLHQDWNGTGSTSSNAILIHSYYDARSTKH
jgi:hypothetical protein